TELSNMEKETLMVLEFLNGMKRLKKFGVKIDNILNGHTSLWQWYKGFFNVTVFRYLVTWFAIVPILAHLFGKFKGEIRIGESVLVLSHSISLSFSLYLLWFSAFFFVIALLLYQSFCPGFIKTYSS